MRDEERIPDELNEIAEALGSLSPRASTTGAGANRDRLMYEAGRQAALRTPKAASAWHWPTATAISTIAATVLAVLLAISDETQTVETIVYVNRSTSQPSADSLTDPGIQEMPAVAPSYAFDSIPSTMFRRRSLVGPRYRLLMHYLADPPEGPVPGGTTSSESALPSNEPVLSPRSLNDLLNESAMISPTVSPQFSPAVDELGEHS